MNFHNMTESAVCYGSPAIRRSKRPWQRFAIVLILLETFLAWGAVTGLAKEKKPPSKTVSGVVFDNAGNALEGATVELTDRQSGKVLDIYSQEGGQYQFADLRFDHDYTLKAMYKNSSSEVRQVSSFDTRTRPVMNLTIPKKN